MRALGLFRAESGFVHFLSTRIIPGSAEEISTKLVEYSQNITFETVGLAPDQLLLMNALAAVIDEAAPDGALCEHGAGGGLREAAVEAGERVDPVVLPVVAQPYGLVVDVEDLQDGLEGCRRGEPRLPFGHHRLLVLCLGRAAVCSEEQQPRQHNLESCSQAHLYMHSRDRNCCRTG